LDFEFLISNFDFLISLPAALRHPGHIALQGQLAETQAAQRELTQERARPAAAAAAVAVTDFESQSLLLSSHFGGCCHWNPSLSVTSSKFKVKLTSSQF
jgi:hypothetical protein